MQSMFNLIEARVTARNFKFYFVTLLSKAKVKLMVESKLFELKVALTRARTSTASDSNNFSAPGSPPFSITASLYGVSTVMVLWYEPKIPNGRITRYKLYYTNNLTLPVQGRTLDNVFVL